MHPIRRFYMFWLKRSSKNFDEYAERYFASSKNKILIPTRLGQTVFWKMPEEIVVNWPVEKGDMYYFIKDGLRMDWFSSCTIS